MAAVDLVALMTKEKVQGAILVKAGFRPDSFGLITSIGFYDRNSMMVIRADQNLHLPVRHTTVEVMPDGVIQFTVTIRSDITVYEIRPSV